MKYTVARGDQVFGEYSLEDIRSMVQSGDLVSSDLVYCDEFENWKKIAEAPELKPPVPPLPVSSPTDQVERQSMKIFCETCGSQQQPNFKFCTNCGTPPATASPTAQTNPQSPDNMGHNQPLPAIPQESTSTTESKPNWIAIGGSAFALIFIIALIGSCDEVMTETDEERKARELRERGLDMMNQGLDDLENAINDLPQ